jgi:hypothetical protein
VIFKVDGGYVISSNNVWLPGSYESERAAKYAFKFSSRVLQRLQDKANERAGGEGGVITFADLQDAGRAA